MKKYILIGILYFTCYFTVGSQYYNFPDSNVVWYFQYACTSCGPPINNYYTISIAGDTLIASNICQILTSSSYYAGAIREDTIIKKVYFIPPSETEEILLYDFNWQIGDTVRGRLGNIWDPDIIQSIDSILVGNEYRKRWLINEYYFIYLIEGIGSTYGLIEPSPGSSVDNDDYTLLCFQQNGQTLFPDTTTVCQLPDINMISEQLPLKINIIPNPSKGLVKILFDNTIIKEIAIYNMLGNKIFFKQLQNETSIEVENLPSGIFIISIVDICGKLTTQKILSCP